MGKVTNTECPACKMTFSSASNRNRHLKTSTSCAGENRVRVSCPECKQTFGRKDDLRQHTIRAHGDPAARAALFTIKCNVCNAKFVKQAHLTRHMNVHLNSTERPRLDCAECRSNLSSQASLERHTAGVHGRDAPLKCTKCTATFRFPYLVRHHVARAVRGEHVKPGAPVKVSNIDTSRSHLSALQVRDQSVVDHGLPRVVITGEWMTVIQLHSVGPSVALCQYGDHPVTAPDVFRVLSEEPISRRLLDPFLAQIIAQSGRVDVQYVSMAYASEEGSGAVRATFNRKLRPSSPIAEKWRLVVPIHLDGHFSLAVVDFRSRSVLLWDSAPRATGDAGRAKQELLLLWNIWASVYHKVATSNWKMKVDWVASIEQPDGTSCDMLVVYYLINYLNADLARNTQQSPDGVAFSTDSGATVNVLATSKVVEIRRRMAIHILFQSAYGRSLLSSIVN